MDESGVPMAMKAAQIKQSAQGLMQQSRALTGIDLADSSVEDPLERLIWSLNNEAQLNDVGAAAMEQRLLRVLSNRLRMQRDFKANPQIAAQTITRPLFLTGGPRTGSTKLHKLLAASGDFLFLPFWQGHCLSLRTGERDEDPAARVEEAGEYIRWIAEHAPQAQRNHRYGTFEPEEEALILEHFICSCFPNVFANVPTFMSWWAAQDYVLQARFLKQSLQYLQWQFHDGDTRPWVLKCPIYQGLEAALAEVFDDALFVTTHRDPVSTVASTAHLVQGYRQSCSDADQRAGLGQAFLDGLEFAAGRHLELRKGRPDLKFLDVSYTDLTGASEHVIEQIYAHTGMALSELARQRVRDWEAKHGHGSHGGARYAPSDFGLTSEIVKERFGKYIETFRHYF
jgi:hypothetical protein